LIRVLRIGSRNIRRFKEELDAYFNSKYLPDLRQYLPNGKKRHEYSMDLLWQYIEQVGTNLDDIRHLHGAAIRLLIINDTNEETQEFHSIVEQTAATKEVLDNAEKTLRQVEKSNQHVRDRILQALKTIQEIDFPRHFDKLDTAISGVNIGIQNIMRICHAIASKAESENQETRNRMEQHYGMLRAATTFNRNLLFVTILLTIGVIIIHLLIR
jgi:uncharacterized protein YoxC